MTLNMSYGQVAPYTKAATPYTGKWPSVNSKGAMVWSERDNQGYWQVWLTQDSPFSTPAMQITTGAANHERPAIDDSGDIVFFQDNTGQGAGWEVVLHPSVGNDSVLEFSSANPPSCHPPDDPNCVAWHTAGQNFGIARDGTTITYYDFCTQGQPPSCVRRFDASGIGTLQCSEGSCNFYGYDYPTINSNGQIAFMDSASNIFYTTTTDPQVPGTQYGSGQCPHLADGLDNSMGDPNPQITYVQSSDALCSVFTEQPTNSASIESNLLLNAIGQQVPVDNGVWASVNNSGAIVYQIQDSDVSPIWFAGNTNGVDLSGVPQISWNEILTQYAPRFVVADAWGGCSSFPAHSILSGALLANQELNVASYAVLNLEPLSCQGNSPPPPAQQMTNAVMAVGNLEPSLKFMAIDLEPGYYDSSKQSQNVQAIVTAINTLQNTYHLNVVIYASCADWRSATGNDTTIARSGIPIWSTRSDTFPDLFDDENTAISGPCQPATGIVPWPSFGGWSGRSGKQYNLGCFKDTRGNWRCNGVTLVPGCNPKVNPSCPCPPPGIGSTQCQDAGRLDLDVFDLSLFR